MIWRGLQPASIRFGISFEGCILYQHLYNPKAKVAYMDIIKIYKQKYEDFINVTRHHPHQTRTDD